MATLTRRHAAGNEAGLGSNTDVIAQIGSVAPVDRVTGFAELSFVVASPALTIPVRTSAALALRVEGTFLPRQARPAHRAIWIKTARRHGNVFHVSAQLATSSTMAVLLHEGSERAREAAQELFEKLRASTSERKR